jgi:iron complex outermembrane receptor protein
VAWRDFSVLASYSYTDAKYEKSNDGNQGNHLENIPDHLFSTWLGWRPSAYWQGFHAGAGLRHVGASWDGADVIKTPDYTLVDAMIGYDVGRWSFSVDVDNLADDKYIASCLARGDCFLGSRRTVTGNVRFNF